ncbi:hypothetical protein D9M71_705440 [compost metagenome]
MTTKVVVVFEDEDFCLWVFFPIEKRRRQPADAAADHHQVVLLADRQIVSGEALFLPAHLVRNFKGADMAATQAGQCGRVVAPAFGRLQQLQRGQSRCDADSDAIDEVATGYFHGFPYLSV